MEKPNRRVPRGGPNFIRKTRVGFPEEMNRATIDELKRERGRGGKERQRKQLLQRTYKGREVGLLKKLFH